MEWGIRTVNTSQLAQVKEKVEPIIPAGVNLAALSLGQAMKVAESLHKSGYFATIKNPEQAFAKILAGQELGIGPMQSLANIHIVEGKPTLDATLVRARIKSSGKYDVKTLASDDTKCSLQFLENGKVIGVCTFTIEDAKRAGLVDKPNWKKYPRAMCLARATMAGAREFTPDVFGGPIYSAEELEPDRAPTSEAVAPPVEEIKNITPLVETEIIEAPKDAAKKAEIAQAAFEIACALKLVTGDKEEFKSYVKATYPGMGWCAVLAALETKLEAMQEPEAEIFESSDDSEPRNEEA